MPSPLVSHPRPAEPRRKNRLTRLGFHFLFVGSFAMLGGALRGFNLLLVLAGLLVGTLIMQWRWSRRSVEAVSVKRRLPTEAFVGKSFRVRYLLHNHSRMMPVWMMRVEDRIKSVDRSDIASAVCGAGVISARQSVGPHCDCTVTRRGRYDFGPVTLMTTFPFSLFSSRQINDTPDQLYVFPALLTLRGDWRRRLISRSGGIATTGRRSGPSEGDFFGLREWQTGDSQKWIHWRTTARTGEPTVRQFEQQRRFDTCVLVDAITPEPADRSRASEQQPRINDKTELAISLAATLMVHLVGSPSNRVVLAVAAEKVEAIICAGSIFGKRRVLELLTDVIPTESPDLSHAAAEALRIVGNTQDLIIVSPRSFAAAQQDDPSLTSTIAPWARRGSFRWIDVGHRDLDRWVAREASGPASPAKISSEIARNGARMCPETSS